MLSNTATPKYYAEYRQLVLDGIIPICKNVSLEMNRIDDLIASPNVYYDDEAVEGWISFCENELTLTDGSDMYLILSFKVWGEQVYGWYYFIDRQVYVPGQGYKRKRLKKRLTNRQYLIVARGAAKSIYLSTHQAYGLTVDSETTKGVTTAPTMIQADEVISPIKTAITRSRGPFFKFLTMGSIQNTTGSKRLRPKLFASKKGIENTLTNSLLEIRPMQITKLQGLRNKYSTVDEWLSCDIREDPIGALEQGASKIDDYLIIAVSSEGTIRNGPGDSIKMELTDILNGDYVAPNVSIWWYRLDELEEIADPEMWLKANPNIGETVSYETYANDVERAEKVPSAKNDIIAKRFGIPVEGFTYFFTYEETLPPSKRKNTFWNLPCSLGADLSMGDDFCAFSFLFPLNQERFGIKLRAYITEKTMLLLHPAMREKYEEFIKEGTLVVMPGAILNMDDVYDDLDQHIIDCSYDVCCFGYDPYGAENFVKRWILDNGEFATEKVIQGVKTETIPLGELKKLASLKYLLFDESIMTFCMGNSVVWEDTNGNRKLYKLRQDRKIDCVSATMDAYVAYKLHKNMFN